MRQVGNRHSNPFTRLELFHKTYFPSTIKLWNEFPEHTRQMDSIESVKRSIKIKYNYAVHH